MIFDSDVLIWFFRGEPGAGRLIDSQPVRRLSIVSMMELLQGAKSKREMSEIRRFFRNNSFDVIPVDEAISYAAAGLIEDHALSDGLQVADALIAATALQFGDILATANVRHFRRVRGLQLKQFRPAVR
ncbi:MAG: type II toxin-antitoxin system VapC family toxin [Bryobacteraceae bacterium]